MKLMWPLRRRQSKEHDEADIALEDAKRNLRQVQRRNGEVTAISNALREIRERNHFAENLESIVLRHGGST